MDEQRFQIAGMDCADCARSIEKGVARLDEVDSAELNFTTGTLCVRGSAPAERVVARVRELGYDVEDGRGAGAGAQGSTASLELSPAPRPPLPPALPPPPPPRTRRTPPARPPAGVCSARPWD